MNLQNALKSSFKLVVIFFLIFGVTNAQQRILEITTKRNDDKSVDIYYEKVKPGSYTVTLTFNTLTNSDESNKVRRTINGFSGKLLTLKPSNALQGISFSYSYSYVLGDHKAKPEVNFKYILPFKNHKTIQVQDLNYLAEKFNGTVPKNWRSFQFITNLNDTVCSARKGVVVEIEGSTKADTTQEYSYNSTSNYIIVEHEDRSLARYDVLKDNSLMVALGDVVYPSTPLALAGTYDTPENSQLRLSIYYLDKDVMDNELNGKETYVNRIQIYSYINPLFYKAEGLTSFLISRSTYTTFYDKNIIELEMTRREKKKWNETK